MAEPMSGMKVILSEAAQVDLRRQSLWYFHQAGVDLADRYLAAFDATVTLLAMQPEAGALRKFRDARLRGLRSVVMAGAFRMHLVFYRFDESEMVIIRVLHGMRDLPRRLTDEPGV